MTPLRLVMGIVILVLLAPVAYVVFQIVILASMFIREYHTWNQEVTVVVDTPTGPARGSAVTKVEAWFGQLPMSGNEVAYRITGEATVVDLGGGKYLFALLTDSEERLHRVFRDRLPDTREVWLREIPELTDERSLTPDQLGDKAYLDRYGYMVVHPGERDQFLITFADMSRPQTVKYVDPNNLAATFGAGYSLREVRIGLTDAAPTSGTIAGILPWLYDPEVMRNPGFRELPLATRNISGDLVRPVPDLGD